MTLATHTVSIRDMNYLSTSYELLTTNSQLSTGTLALRRSMQQVYAASCTWACIGPYDTTTWSRRPIKRTATDEVVAKLVNKYIHTFQRQLACSLSAVNLSTTCTLMIPSLGLLVLLKTSLAYKMLSVPFLTADFKPSVSQLSKD